MINDQGLGAQDKLYVYALKDGSGFIGRERPDGATEPVYAEYATPEEAILSAQEWALTAQCTVEILPSARPWIGEAEKLRRYRLEYDAEVLAARADR